MNQIESNMTELNSTKIGLPRNLTRDQNKPFFKLGTIRNNRNLTYCYSPKKKKIKNYIYCE